jgi:L-ornithine N5-oxygenase
MESKVYDVLGIGFGPANLALAIALEEGGWTDNVAFLESRACAAWQPGMLLDGTDIQNNPLRDLVTPRNPLSRYGFVNFLHTQGRFFDYLNLGLHFPLRKEFARYIEWVASFFGRWVHYGCNAVEIAVDEDRRLFKVSTTAGYTYWTRALVVAPGRTPLIPEQFRSAVGDQVFHLTRYLPKMTGGVPLNPRGNVCVIGGSQSAGEIVLDLHTRFPDLQITNIMRGFGYQLKDTSPFSERVYFPEFVDYFFNCSPKSKRSLTESLRRTNYSSADADIINRLCVTLYEERLNGRCRIEVATNRAITMARLVDGLVELSMTEIHHDEVEQRRFDRVILATGFLDLGVGPGKEPYPSILETIHDRLVMNDQGFLHVNRDYSVSAVDDRGDLPPLYVNGLCEPSHGFGDSGSFSLLSLRAAEISESLAARLAAALHVGRTAAARDAVAPVHYPAVTANTAAPSVEAVSLPSMEAI